MKTFRLAVEVTDAHIFDVEAGTQEEAFAKLRKAMDEGVTSEFFVKTCDGDYKPDTMELVEEMEEMKK